jgi:hypothetical protein
VNAKAIYSRNFGIASPNSVSELQSAARPDMFRDAS